ILLDNLLREIHEMKHFNVQFGHVQEFLPHRTDNRTPNMTQTYATQASNCTISYFPAHQNRLAHLLRKSRFMMEIDSAENVYVILFTKTGYGIFFCIPYYAIILLAVMKLRRQCTSIQFGVSSDWLN
ncbi:hypothetical protein L9F63_024822, partial [Diploptera punctata]